MADLAIKWGIAVLIASIVTRRVMPANAAAAHRVWLLVLLMPLWWAGGQRLVEPVLSAQLRRGALPAAIAPSAGVLDVLFAAYVVVASVLLLRVAAGAWSVRRLIRGSRPLGAADGGAPATVMGVPKARIRQGSLDVPVTAGVLTPVIILPAGWQSMPPGTLAAILHHEAAHVRRRDCAVALAAAVIEAVFWFHPAAWVAASRVRWFAEMACDAEAARAMDDRTYAGALLSVAAGWSRARRPRYALMAGAGTDVARRIHLLLDELEHGGRRSRLLAIAPVVLIAGLPAAALIETGRLSDGQGSHAVSHAAHMRHAHE